MRRAAVVAAVAFLAVAGVIACGDNSGEGPAPGALQGCPELATWSSLHFAERAGGSCGPLAPFEPGAEGGEAHELAGSYCASFVDAADCALVIGCEDRDNPRGYTRSVLVLRGREGGAYLRVHPPFLGGPECESEYNVVAR